MYRAGCRVETLVPIEGSRRKGTVSCVDKRDGTLYVSLDYLEAYDSSNSEVAFKVEEVQPLRESCCG